MPFVSWYIFYHCDMYFSSSVQSTLHFSFLAYSILISHSSLLFLSMKFSNVYRQYHYSITILIWFFQPSVKFMSKRYIERCILHKKPFFYVLSQYSISMRLRQKHSMLSQKKPCFRSIIIYPLAFYSLVHFNVFCTNRR